MKHLTLMTIALLLLGSDCEQARLNSYDNGFLEDVLPDLGPWRALSYDNALDQELVDQASGWWNDQLGITVFDPESPRIIWVSSGYTGQLPDADGIARITFDDQGVITACEIVVSSDITYHDHTVREILKHELGHCPLALAHDDKSVDLNSIMSYPQVYSGEVTRKDLELLIGAF